MSMSHAQLIQEAFDSTISMDYGTYRTGEPGGQEQGVDVGLGSNAVVRLPTQSEYLGTSYGGYRSYFKDMVTNAIVYFQHIIQNPMMTPGAIYDAGSPVGWVSPGTTMTSQAAAAGFSSSGPHLEYGVLPDTGVDMSMQAVQAGTTADTLANSWYSSESPYVNLTADEASVKKTSNGGTGSIPVITGAGNVLGQIGNGVGQYFQNTGSELYNQVNHPFDTFLTDIGLPTTSAIGTSLKKWGIIILLSIGVLLLVLELFKGGSA